MKKYYVFILLSAIIFSSFLVYAKNKPGGDEEHVEVSPGMEIKRVGAVNRLVPIGTKVVDKDGLVTTESMGAYVSRRFIETGNRFDAIENTLAAMKETLQSLQYEIAQLKKEKSESGIVVISSNIEP
jgi:hypothetical protein